MKTGSSAGSALLHLPGTPVVLSGVLGSSFLDRDKPCAATIG